MKKLLMSTMLIMITVLFAACGGNNADSNNNEIANNSNNNDISTNENNNEGTESLTTEEVFTQVTEAYSEIESVKTISKVEQDMDINGEQMSMVNHTDMEYILDPITVKQDMTVELPGEGTQNVQVYITEDGYYTYEESQDMWMKFPDSFVEPLLEQVKMGNDIEIQMNQFESMKDDFELEETDEHYILTFKLSDEDAFNQEVEKVLESTLPDDFNALGEDIFESISYEQLEYEMTIDKDTFYVQELNMIMDMTMDLEGETMKIKQNMETTYTDYNEVEAIEIPEEAIENAQELNM